MKKLILKHIFLILLIALLVLSCKKKLHEEILSLSKIDSKEELIDATTAIYGTLRSYSKRENVLGDDVSYYLPDCYFYYDKTFCVTKTSHPNVVNKLDPDWSDAYLSIENANNLILQYNSIKKTSEINNIYGEIYFLRAYLYYVLTETYGRVPLILDTDVNYDVRRASFEEIYTQIEKDLKKASELLPGNNASARIPYVTPCRGTAKALLAEVYLIWAGYPAKDNQKYTDAARVAAEVIDSAYYFGYEMLPDFADLWRKKHLFNNENIFSFYCNNYDESAEGGLSIYYKFYFQHLAPEVDFYNNYPVGYRKEITFETYYKKYITTVVDTYRIIIRITDSVVVKLDKIDPCARTSYKKFFLDTSVSRYYITNTNGDTVFHSEQTLGMGRIYLLRYAQTLLTYSEAMARSGQLNDKAYECVNMIRRRARHLPLNEPSAYDLQKGLSPEVFADSVVWERAWELCAENDVRWNDLRRLELVEKLPEMRNELEGGPPLKFDKSVYYSPIPTSDVRLNPKLVEK